MKITEHTYELAKAKLAEYEARKDATVKAFLLTFPPEMSSCDKQVAIDRLGDVLSDAYFELVSQCELARDVYENEEQEMHKHQESPTYGRIAHA